MQRNSKQNSPQENGIPKSSDISGSFWHNPLKIVWLFLNNPTIRGGDILNKIVLISLVSLAVIILLSGCPQTPPSDGTPDTDTDNGGAPPPANGTPGPGPGPDVGDPFSDFVNLFSQTPEYMVVYDTMVVYAAQGTGATRTYTIYQKGDVLRYDMSMENMDTRTWLTPDKIVVCRQLQLSLPETCNELPRLSGQGGPTVDAEEIQQEEADYTITSLGQRTIAGETGNCYQLIYSGAEETVESEYCGTSDGILLYSKTIIEGMTSEMTATNVARSVPDAEMVPPETGNGIPYP